MKEFMLVFRNVQPTGDAALTPEQLKDISKPWQDWIGSIAAQNKLASRGNRLDFEGATLRENVVTDGPYAEIKEIILGYIVVKANSLTEAIQFGKDCPILKTGGSVEVRNVVLMNA